MVTPFWKSPDSPESRKIKMEMLNQLTGKGKGKMFQEQHCHTPLGNRTMPDLAAKLQKRGPVQAHERKREFDFDHLSPKCSFSANKRRRRLQFDDLPPPECSTSHSDLAAKLQKPSPVQAHERKREFDFDHLSPKCSFSANKRKRRLQFDDLPPPECSTSQSESDNSNFELIFLGTGTSQRVPTLGCMTCNVCKDAAMPKSKNKRMNTCLAIRQLDSNFIILIDCGKTFYEAATTILRENRIKMIDALILTHVHEDTVSGFDDLRGLLYYRSSGITVYLTQGALEELNTTKKYIVDSEEVFHFKLIKEDEPFLVNGMAFIPLLVHHGKCRDDSEMYFEALGFRFGGVCYISDVDDIPASTYSLLEDCKILIIDACIPGSTLPHSGHFGYVQALKAVDKIKPQMALLTGLSHRMDYCKMAEKASKNKTVVIKLAYDGLVITSSELAKLARERARAEFQDWEKKEEERTPRHFAKVEDKYKNQTTKGFLSGKYQDTFAAKSPL